MKFKNFAAAVLIAAMTAAGTAQAAQLTLDECLAQAIANNPDLTAAEGRVSSQKATIGQAQSTGNPQVSASAGYSRGGSGLSSSNNTGSYSSGVNLEQNITDWGRRQTKVKGAQLNTQAAEQDYSSTRQTVIQNVYAAYYLLNMAVRDLSIAETKYDNFDKRLKWARDYYSVGTKAKIEVTKAESDLAASKLTIVRAQAQIQQYRAQLANAMGLPLLPVADVADMLSYKQWSVGLEDAVKRSMEERPEVLAEKKRVEYAETYLTLQKKGLSPYLDASAGYNTGGASVIDDSQWSSKLTLSVPITDGGLTKYNVEQAQAQLLTAQAELKSLENSVTLAVRQAWEALREAQEALVSARESERASKATLELAQGRYKAGVGDNLEISDAVDNYATAQTNTVLALYNCKNAQLDLEYAMGGLEYGK